MAREMNLDRRASRLNKNFKMTEKNAAKVRRLNELLVKKQEALQRKMVYMAERIGELAKSEFPFLQGFKVFGELDFYKNLPSDDKNESEMTKAERGKIKKWRGIEEDMDFHWELQYDVEKKEFTALSKMFLTKGIWWWSLPDGIEFCGYLYYLLENCDSIALQDLFECDESDWTESVDVEVNFPDEISFEPIYSTFNDTRTERVIEERKAFFDRQFDWSEENIKKILEVNAAFIEKIDAMRSQLLALHKRLTELAKTDAAFRGFCCDAKLQYQNRSHPTDIADLPLLRIMEEICHNSLDIWIFMRDGDAPEECDKFLYNRKETNYGGWHFEWFAEHFTEEQKKLPFSFAMHEIFVDGYAYSLEDLVRMKMEDWVTCYSISF